MRETISRIAKPGTGLTSAQVAELISQTCAPDDYRGKRVLLIVPDGTRTAPIGLLFRTLHHQIARETKAFDVLVALGTHQPMNEAAICGRLEISETERRDVYSRVKFFNHAWDNPAALKQVGTLTADETRQLTDGLFATDVPVEINRMLFDYDQIIIIGPVFPHEVVGFSGGNKYLVPGVAGPQILNFFHWLGAVVTNPMIIGNKWTPVRRVVDRSRFFRREQVPGAGRRRPPDPELLPLAGRRGDQPDDHRQQMDTCASSRGPRRLDGRRGQALFLPGG